MFPVLRIPFSYHRMSSPSDSPSQPTDASSAVAALDAEYREASVQVLEQKAAELRDAGESPEALKFFQAALEKALAKALTPDVIAHLRVSIAVQADHTGNDAEAIAHYEQAIKDLAALQPPDVMTGAQLRNNLAMIYKRLGKFALAEQHYLASVEAIEGLHGKQSEDVASLYNNLGGLYYAAGFPDQAKEVFLEALDMRTQLLGDDHPDVAQTLCNLGSVYYELGDNAAAQTSFEKSLRILENHIKDEFASYEAVGRDYVALLTAIEEDGKAEIFQRRLVNVLAKLKSE